MSVNHLPATTGSISDVAQIDGTAMIGPNSVIGPDVTIAEGVRIGANVVFASRHFTPESEKIPAVSRTIVERGAEIHPSAVIMPGVTIGAHAEIGPNAVVYHSVPQNAVVAGNPARIVGYVETSRPAAGVPAADASIASVTETSVSGVVLHRLPLISDIRGGLTVGEFERTLPFAAKRYFVIFDVPSVETRGEHAHRRCNEFLVCVNGSCSVVADDGKVRQEFRLDQPNVGLFLPHMVWRVHYKYSPDAVLVVFASEYYDPADYIRDYNEFLHESRAGR